MGRQRVSVRVSQPHANRLLATNRHRLPGNPNHPATPTRTSRTSAPSRGLQTLHALRARAPVKLWDAHLVFLAGAPGQFLTRPSPKPEEEKNGGGRSRGCGTLPSATSCPTRRRRACCRRQRGRGRRCYWPYSADTGSPCRGSSGGFGHRQERSRRASPRSRQREPTRAPGSPRGRCRGGGVWHRGWRIKHGATSWGRCVCVPS